MAVGNILFLLSLFAAIALANSKASLSRHQAALILENDSDYDSICQTEDCHKIANGIINAMDKSVDPCDNFWEYTCGNWEKKHPILPGMTRRGRYDFLFQQRLNEILMEDVQDLDIKPVKQAKTWYQSCMDTEELYRIGVKHIESLTKKVGGWPIALEKGICNEMNHTWSEIERYYRNVMGRTPNFDDFYKDPMRPYNVEARINVFASESLLKRKKFVDSSSYLELLTNTIKMFVELGGTGISEETYTNEARDLVNFEKKILNWVQLKNNAVDLDADLTVKPTKWSMVFDDLLDDTTLRTKVNYIHWNYIFEMLPYTTEGMRDKLFELKRNGRAEREPRWLECLNEMKMVYAAAYIYSNKYFRAFPQDSAPNQEIADNMHTALKKGLRNFRRIHDSLNEDSLKWVIDSMKVFPGIGEWFIDGELVSDYYEGFEADSYYLDTTLSYMRFQSKKQSTVFEHSYRFTKTHVAYSDENILDTGIRNFLPNLHVSGIPSNVDYGFIAPSIGFEFRYRFKGTIDKFMRDPTESGGIVCFEQFDQFMGNTSMSDYDRQVILDSARPRIRGSNDILANYKYTDTMSKNIGAAAGLQVAFEAYKQLKAKKGSYEKKLPGLEDLSNEQLFFIAFASSQCETVKPQLEESMRYNGTVTNSFKVIDSVMNSNYFAEAFNCPNGSPMNPNDKCNVWKERHSKKKQ